MQIKQNRGFTLIELLVVVTIIGILTTVSLVSMSAAKRTGNDAAVKADLATVQTQGSLYYSVGNTYGATNTSCAPASNSVFDGSQEINKIIKSAIQDATKNASGNTITCKSSTQAFLVAAKLTNGNYWCIDSHGAAREVPAATDFSSLSFCP